MIEAWYVGKVVQKGSRQLAGYIGSVSCLGPGGVEHRFETLDQGQCQRRMLK